MSSLIRFRCTTCNTVMEAPLGRGGDKINCLKCGQRLQIPSPKHAQTVLATDLTAPESVPIPVAHAHIAPPLPTAVPLAPALPPIAELVEPLSETAAVRRRGAKFNVWAILLLAGAGLLFLNFFLPWWRFRETESDFDVDLRKIDTMTRAQAEAEERRISEGQRRIKEWIVNTVSLSKLIRLEAAGATSLWLFGWDTTPGIVGLFFSLLIVGGLLPMLIVRRLQPWVWIPSFGSALLALILLPFSFVWIFGAPSGTYGNVSAGHLPGPYVLLLASLLLITRSGTYGNVSAGHLPGPYVLLLASLLLITSGTVNGVFQVRLFARARRGNH